MCYFVIIRGPAGVGKTVVAKKLAKRLCGTYISFDKIMRNNRLDKIETGCINEKNFIEANKIAIQIAIKSLKKGRTVIFDGCFYYKSQIEHLLKNMPFNSYVFTLKAGLDECISRDKKRSKRARIGEKCVREVYNLVSRFDCGILINTAGKVPEEIITEILSKMPENLGSFFTK